jgi:hypothetical protein
MGYTYTITVKEALYEDADYILLAQNGVHWRGFMGIIIFGFQRQREIRRIYRRFLGA